MANIIELKNKKTGVKQYPITKSQAVYGPDGSAVSQKLVTDEADIASLKEQVSGFTRLSEGSTTGDAELINTRTTWYGTTEASAGDAVRNQAENLILTQSGKPTGNALKGNKVWIKPSQDDIEIPDMDDFNKVNTSIENFITYQTETDIKSLINISGGIYHQTGKDNNSSSNINTVSRSDYIQVNKGDFISFSGIRVSQSSAAIAFYDNNKIYDKSLSIAGTNISGQTDNLTIIKNGYVRLSCRKDHLERATFTIQNNIGINFKNIQNQIDVINSEIERANINKSEYSYLLTRTIDINTLFKNSGRLGQNGAIYEGGNYGVSDFLPCNKEDILNYKLSTQADYAILVTYDANLNVVDSVVSTGGTGDYIEATKTFTSEEKYFRVSGATTAERYKNYYVKYNLSYVQADTIYDIIPAVDKTLMITDAAADAKTTGDALTTINNKIINLSSNVDKPEYSYYLTQAIGVNILFKNSGRLSKSGAIIEGGNYGVSDLLPCNEGDTLEYKLSTQTNYAVLITYDTNLNVIDSVISTGGTGNYIEATKTFTSEEKYFRVSGATTVERYRNYYVKYNLLYLQADTIYDDIYDNFNLIEADIVDLQDDVIDLDETINEKKLPSYWKNYMQEKYPILWEKDALIGNGGDSFIFITDIHVQRNRMQSPKLINAIIKNTAVKTVFCGGDYIDHQDTTAGAIELLETWQSKLQGLRVFNIVGNHDNNNFNSSQPDVALTKGQYYGIMAKPEEQWINTGGELYYCIDNESQKIRYICLAIEAFDTVGSSGTQRTWFQNALTEKDATWTILVMQHRIWPSTTESIASNAQAVIDAINEVWGNINASFIGIIAGHTHLDYAIKESTNGYNLIAVNCDTNSGTNSGYTRTAGTTTEQSFDVFYIDKTNKKLYAVRIGAGDSVVGEGSGIREFTY